MATDVNVLAVSPTTVQRNKKQRRVVNASFLVNDDKLGPNSDYSLRNKNNNNNNSNSNNNNNEQTTPAYPGVGTQEWLATPGVATTPAYPPPT